MIFYHIHNTRHKNELPLNLSRRISYPPTPSLTRRFQFAGRKLHIEQLFYRLEIASYNYNRYRYKNKNTQQKKFEEELKKLANQTRKIKNEIGANNNSL